MSTRDEDEQHAPRARSQELVTEVADGELLVYDLRSDVAHHLGPQATVVWRACDGRGSVGELAARTGLGAEEVESALTALAERDLLDDAAVSRRAWLQLAAVTGAAGVAVPLIRSLAAPTAAQASTLLPGGSACSDSRQCQSGTCAGGLCTPA